MPNFHPLEGVGRGSETQLQVGENLDFKVIITSIDVFSPFSCVSSM